jgi:phosphohistidine phosphatase
MELYLLRHAHAGDPDAWDRPDALRPLSERGERQAEALGTFLARIGFQPDAIVTSPKVRAAETAELVAKHLGVTVTVDDRLGGPLDPGVVEGIVADVEASSRVVLVGHDPDFSELVASLSGNADVPMKKGALARIDIDRPIEAAGGRLRWLIPPDALSRR